MRGCVAGLIVVVAGYITWCIYLGRAHRVVLVNGLNIPYPVQIGDAVFELPAKAEVTAPIPDGPFIAEAIGLDLPVSVTGEFNTAWWARPFDRRTAIINVDAAAVFQVESSAMGTRARTLHVGDGFYLFEPDNTRRLHPHDDQALLQRMLAIAAPDDLVSLCLTRAIYEPDNELFVRLLPSVMDTEPLLEFLREQCAMRPLRVEMHRTYQDVIDKVAPDFDRVAAYRALLDEEPNDPVRQYLLARVLPDEREAAANFEAAAGHDPTGRSHGGLAWLALCAGEGEKALAAAEQALARDPNKPSFEHLRQAARHATARYDPLCRYWSQRLGESPLNTEAALERVGLHTQAGRPDVAQTIAADFLRRADAVWPGEHITQWRSAFDLRMASATGDVEAARRALRSVADQPTAAWMLALLEGRAGDAATMLGNWPNDRVEAWDDLAVAIAAAISGKDDLAAAQRRLAADRLQHGGSEARYLARVLRGDEPVDVPRLKRLAVDPLNKRIALVAIGLAGHPDLARFAADKLNYDPTWPRILLHQAVMSLDGNAPSGDD